MSNTANNAAMGANKITLKPLYATKIKKDKAKSIIKMSIFYLSKVNCKIYSAPQNANFPYRINLFRKYLHIETGSSGAFGGRTLNFHQVITRFLKPVAGDGIPHLCVVIGINV